MSIEAIGIVLMLAMVVEALVEVIKSWVPGAVVPPEWLWPVTSAALAIALCILAEVDVVEIAGITLHVPAVGEVMTGVLISRGASFVHDLWGKFTEKPLP